MDQASDPDAIVGDADVTEADLAHAVTQLPGWKRPWLVPALLAGGSLLFLILRPSPPGEQTLTIVLPMIFVVMLSTFFQWGARRAWVKQALANVGGRTTFRFDDYGFISESSLRQHRLAWATLTRALETPLCFLVYTTPATLLIVPKRAFSDADVASLSQRLRERITPAPQKGGPLKNQAQRTLLLWVVLLVTFLSIWHFLAPQRREQAHHETNATLAESSNGGEPSDVDSSR